MNYTRTLAGMLLLTLSSFALAATHSGHAAGGGHTAGAAAASAHSEGAASAHSEGTASAHSEGTASAHSEATPSPAGGVNASAPFKGVAVSQETIGGREAMMAHLPARAPLTPDERRTLRTAGYSELSDGKGSYYCHRVPTKPSGWTNECFRFDARGNFQGNEAKESQPKADPKAKDAGKDPGKDAPRPVTSRVEYG
jgi:hypothetical protein